MAGENYIYPLSHTQIWCSSLLHKTQTEPECESSSQRLAFYKSICLIADLERKLWREIAPCNPIVEHCPQPHPIPIFRFSHAVHQEECGLIPHLHFIKPSAVAHSA